MLSVLSTTVVDPIDTSAAALPSITRHRRGVNGTRERSSDATNARSLFNLKKVKAPFAPSILDNVDIDCFALLYDVAESLRRDINDDVPQFVHLRNKQNVRRPFPPSLLFSLLYFRRSPFALLFLLRVPFSRSVLLVFIPFFDRSTVLQRDIR